jgi:prevent-host-death family protein
MKATAKDLRVHSKELLDTVGRGEEVTITYRGKPCAKLVPIETDTDKSRETNRLFGMWKDYTETEDIDGYIRKLRKGRF